MDTTTPFHLPNKDSNHPVSEVSIPEFSASSLARVVCPCSVLIMMPFEAVLLGIKEQHWPPSITQPPPFSANIVSNAILFSHAILLVASNCSAIFYSISSIIYGPLQIVVNIIDPIYIIINSYLPKQSLVSERRYRGRQPKYSFGGKYF